MDPAKTVKEVVMEGVQPIVDALTEYEEINQKFGLPEYYEDQEKMDKLFARQAELQDIIDATDAWNLDSKLERAMDALRCPPEDQSVEHLSGGERRRVALCRAARPKTSRWNICQEANVVVWLSAVCFCRSRTSYCWTSRPTTSMLNLSTGWSNTCSSTKVR